jgi:ankyrin repeat protein
MANIPPYIFDKEQYSDALNRFRDQPIKDARGLDKVDSLDYFIGPETKTLFHDFIPNPLSSEYRIELHEAVRYEDFDAVKILLDNNYIDVDHLSTQGETPLILATSQEMANLLLSYGADATKSRPYLHC